MTATTAILPFATGSGSNIDTDAQFTTFLATLSGSGNGYPIGAVPTAAQLNKLLRQSSFIAAGVANWMVSVGISVPDDGNLSALVSNIALALTNYLDHYLVISSNTTLLATQTRSTIDLRAGIVTLPTPTAGLHYKFYNPSAGSGSIKSSSTALIYYPDGGSVAAGVAIGLDADATLDLYADGYNWFITNMTGEAIVRLSALPNAAARNDQLYGKGMSNANYTSSGRVYGTVYPNSTVSPKFVAVTVGDMAGGDVTLQADAGAGYIVLDKTTDYGTGGSTQKLSGFIPAGANYKVVLSAGAGSPALVNWVEYGL